MKMGTQIKLPDGRVGTVVYNSLVGVGIKWGLHNPHPNDFIGTDGNTSYDYAPENFLWQPDALLRKPEMTDRLGMECVGEKFKIIKEGVGL